MKEEKMVTASTTHADAEAASAVAEKATRKAHEVEQSEIGKTPEAQKERAMNVVSAHNTAADAHNEAAAAHGAAAVATKDGKSGSEHMAALSFHAAKAIEHRSQARYAVPPSTR